MPLQTLGVEGFSHHQIAPPFTDEQPGDFASRYIRLVEDGYQAPDVVAQPPILEIEPQQLMIMGYVAHGRTINQIRKKDPSLSRGDIVGVEEDLQEAFGVRTTSAVVHQMIVRGILPIELVTDESPTRQLTKPDRATIRSYAAGRVPEQIAQNLGMTVRELIDYEKGLHKKIGAWTRPHSVLQGHRLGVLRLGLAEVGPH